MARQSKGQKETVERVMHEYKHGELKQAGGRKVKSRKQAVAIALHEAGSSKYESPSKNRQNLKKTKTKEHRGATAKDAAEGKHTKAELYEQAKKRDIPGRSRMDKAELERALKK